MIRIQDVCYRYVGKSGVFSLGPITTEIEPGRLEFWVGHNGSGKSTLARILSLELPPDQGTVTGLKGSAVHHHQSVMDNVFPDLTVADHFRLVVDSRDERAESILNQFPEVATLRGKYPDELSGGQLQLVAFVTLLMTKHSLYVFDEVLNHLDPERAIKVVSCIRDVLARRDGTHCVIISHDIGLIQATADVVKVFSEGKLAHCLTRDELQAKDFTNRFLVGNTF